mmetsp:Transcript_55215/g.131138  ORF Transcript_55215/g.131138 Transcript_55215/m.131138 type:complete len:267 (+) Transcript_55215:2291-3091(+)
MVSRAAAFSRFATSATAFASAASRAAFSEAARAQRKSFWGIMSESFVFRLSISPVRFLPSASCSEMSLRSASASAASASAVCFTWSKRVSRLRCSSPATIPAICSRTASRSCLAFVAWEAEYSTCAARSRSCLCITSPSSTRSLLVCSATESSFLGTRSASVARQSSRFAWVCFARACRRRISTSFRWPSRALSSAFASAPTIFARAARSSLRGTSSSCRARRASRSFSSEATLSSSALSALLAASKSWRRAAISSDLESRSAMRL